MYAILNHNTQTLVQHDGFDGVEGPYVFATEDKAYDWIEDQSKHIEIDGFDVVKLWKKK